MMSELARDFFSDNPAIAGPLVAMVLFGVVFAAAIVRVLRTEKSHVNKMAHLPLEGDGVMDEEVQHG